MTPEFLCLSVSTLVDMRALLTSVGYVSSQSILDFPVVFSGSRGALRSFVPMDPVDFRGWVLLLVIEFPRVAGCPRKFKAKSKSELLGVLTYTLTPYREGFIQLYVLFHIRFPRASFSLLCLWMLVPVAF